MKRTMKFFARLYPSSWRARYGAELECLLEETRPSVRDAFDILLGALKMQITTRSFRRTMLACAGAGILAATAISFAVPVHYQSQVSLMLTPADEPVNLLVRKVAKTVLRPESLASIIQENNLYPRERAAMSLDDVISKMRTKIRVTTVPPGLPGNRDALTFIIQFDYPDPHVAQQVDSELISRFMESIARSGESAAETHPLQDLRFTLRELDPPSFAGPNRTRFAAVGLLTGIFCGVMLALVARARRITAG